MKKGDKPRECAKEALAALRAICADEEAKASDRVAAAKLLLEYSRPEEAKEEQDNTLHVVMEVPKEYLT